MFATVHVLKQMWRIRKRRCSWSAPFRLFAYFLFYLYSVILFALSFIMVGLFYAAFSIFVRGLLPSKNGMNPTYAGNMLENGYVIFIFFCIMLSTSVHITSAETGFRICSLVMAACTVLMVVSSVFYALDERDSLTSMILIASFIGSFFVPLVFNIHNLKIIDSIRGILYGGLMSGTYANIIPIYAICNIHDVSWGTRSTAKKNQNLSQELIDANEKKELDYKAFRSTFLIIWLIVNIIVGGTVTRWSRYGQKEFLFGLGVMLAGIVGVKIFFSVLHIFVSWFLK